MTAPTEIVGLIVRGLAALCIGVLDSASAAQPDPADAKASVPPMSYRSALDGYRGFDESKLAPWAAANEVVRERGGWRSYAREAREPEKAASQPQSPATPAHQMHRDANQR